MAYKQDDLADEMLVLLVVLSKVHVGNVTDRLERRHWLDAWRETLAKQLICTHSIVIVWVQEHLNQSRAIRVASHHSAPSRCC